MSIAESPAAEARDWQPLDMIERRILGVLVEKAKTTPDAYPLSVNALVTGSSQKSNRDPIMSLEDYQIEDGLARCQKRGLVQRVQTGRVDRWKHLLYDAWKVDKVELAILAELLLRGPQSEGDLRGRVSRMEPIDDLDQLRGKLKPLIQRRLAVYLTPEDRRGAVLTHGFHDPEELEGIRRRLAATGSATPPASSPSPAVDPGLEQLRAELASLREEVATLRQRLDQLEQDLR